VSLNDLDGYHSGAQKYEREIIGMHFQNKQIEVMGLIIEFL
jgi:superfamily II helicase